MTVKRQHLVWRKYLSSWTDKPETTNGKIFVYDKKLVKLGIITSMTLQLKNIHMI